MAGLDGRRLDAVFCRAGVPEAAKPFEKGGRVTDVWEMMILTETTRDGQGIIQSSREFLALDPEAEAKWDEILEKFDRQAWGMLNSIDDFSHQEARGCPWAIIAFPEEYRLAGHLISIRADRADFVFTSYSMGRDYSILENGPPPVSEILVYRRAGFAKAAGQSPLLRPAWEALRRLPEAQSWFCISDPPPAAWLAQAQVDDDALFMSKLRG